MTDWDAWHNGYGDPESLLSERLRVVQRHIEEWLEATFPRPVTVVSACAGDGRDLLHVLERRVDADRVTATILEADTRIAERARRNASCLGLSGIEVRCTDAGITRAYVGAVPADLVLLCGVFGNIPDEDIERTIATLPQFCTPDALVIWTRHRQPPDLTRRVRDWFAECEFHEESFTAPGHAMFSVGAHRFHGEPRPLAMDQHLFSFFT